MLPFDRQTSHPGQMPRRLISLLVLWIAFQVPSAPAQFTYIGSDFGYSSIRLKGEGHNYIMTLPVRLTVVSRPWRHFGGGVTYSIPLSQKVEFTPTGAGGGVSSGWGSDYRPTILNDIIAKDEFSGFLRFFFDTEFNFFLDGRIRSYIIEQHFSLYRKYKPAVFTSSGSLAYAEIPFHSASFATRRRSISPGLSLGFAPHIGKHGFVSFQFEIDYIELKSQPFAMTLESKSNYGQSWYEYKTIRSELHGPTIAWMVMIGGGIFF